MEVELLSWKYFHDFVYQQMLQRTVYVFRGQRCDDWSLLSTLDRLLAGSTSTTARADHLNRFKFSVRGRRGPNPPNALSENEWWALGQHFGLATPLLDWTTSPFVAAYFAFYQKKSPQTENRAIWAFASSAAESRSRELAAHFKGEGRPPVVEVVKPMSDENARLVSQGGLFTRAPDGIALDEWVRQAYSGSKRAALVKFTMPNTDREDALRSLNRMNINHLSLFPDLYGAGVFSNLSLEIPKY